METACAANLTSSAANHNLINITVGAQTSDEIVYDKSKIFCVTLPVGTNTTNLEPIGWPNDALKVTPSPPGLGTCVGMWVNAEAVSKWKCDAGADIVIRNKTTLKPVGSKHLKILRPVSTTSVYHSMYRCQALPGVPELVRKSLGRPAGGMRWDVTIHGERDANNNEPVFDDSFLQEHAGITEFDTCGMSSFKTSGAKINYNGQDGINVWADVLSLCSNKNAGTNYWILARGCQYSVTQTFSLGKCDFPGRDVNNLQKTITHAHTISPIFRDYQTNRDDSTNGPSPVMKWDQQK